MRFANKDNLAQMCQEATRRAYPDGYGFAIEYCSGAADATIQLHKAACAAVAFAFSKIGVKRQLHKAPDIARFALAMAELPHSGTIRQWFDADGKPVKLARSIRQNRDGTYEGGWRCEEYPATYGWLVEGVQLVLHAALGDCWPPAIVRRCREALREAGHPGYR